jgi:iron complex transport system permease protein
LAVPRSVPRWFPAAALFGLAATAAAGLALGSAPVAAAEALRALLRAAGAPVSVPDATYTIVVELRLPRVALAAVVGAALATSGAVYQGLFRNPLADPYVIGVASGAALGAVGVISAGLGGLWVVGAAFAAGVGTVAVVFRLAAARRAAPEDLLLAGLAVGSFLAAVLSVVLVLSHSSLQQALAWLLGSFGGRGWPHLALALPAVAAGYALARWHARELDVLLLTEDEAAAAGVDVPSVRRRLLAAATLLAAASVASAGVVGFVGLVVPHAVRRVVGPGHAALLPGSAVCGAALLVWADLAARTAASPLEIPVGALTALLGVPFFLWLLVRREA